jgi:endoglucanase
MFDLLAELTTLPGPSGYERAVARRMLSGMRELGVDTHMDRMGNVVAYLPGRCHERKLMLSAHTDEVGLMVKCISEDGYLYVDQNGIVSVGGLPGAIVQIVARDCLYPGVVGARSAHLMLEDEASKPVTLLDVWVDVGASRREDVLAMGIHHGTPIVFQPNLQRMQDGCVVGKALDDRVGCSLLLRTLEHLSRQAALEVDLYVVAVVQEEVGSRGARVAARCIAPDWAVIVDTVPASDPSTVPQKTSSELGKGPVVRAMEQLPNKMGTLFSAAVSERLVALAQQAGLPVQRDIFRTWSDASTIHMEGKEGIAMGSVLVPRRYSHSAAEVVRLSDIEAAESLILAFLKSVSPEDLAGPSWLD